MKNFRQHLSETSINYQIEMKNGSMTTKAHYPEENLVNLTVYSFDPSTDDSLIEDLDRYRTDHILRKKSDESINYSQKRLNFSEQEAISVYYKEDEIVGFSTAWNRDFYPKRSSRVLNRFWFDSDIRRPATKVVLRFPVFISVEHQCIILKDKSYDWVFISRPAKSLRWSSVLAERLEINSQFKGWRHSDELHLVCSDESSESCWQNIVYFPMSNSTDDFGLLNRSMSLEEWHERFKKKA